MNFEWDPLKAITNKKKHGVAFETAVTAFVDENSLIIADPDHSLDEDRYVLLGLSRSLCVLIVCYCYRSPDDVIRIISARKANKSERTHYGARCHAQELRLQ